MDEEMMMMMMMNNERVNKERGKRRRGESLNTSPKNIHRYIISRNDYNS